MVINQSYNKKDSQMKKFPHYFFWLIRKTEDKKVL